MFKVAPPPDKEVRETAPVSAAPLRLAGVSAKLTETPEGMMTLATLARSGTTPVTPRLLVAAQLLGSNQLPVLPPTQVTESRWVMAPVELVMPALARTSGFCSGSLTSTVTW